MLIFATISDLNPAPHIISNSRLQPLATRKKTTYTTAAEEIRTQQCHARNATVPEYQHVQPLTLTALSISLPSTKTPNVSPAEVANVIIRPSGLA